MANYNPDENAFDDDYYVIDEPPSPTPVPRPYAEPDYLGILQQQLLQLAVDPLPPIPFYWTVSQELDVDWDD